MSQPFELFAACQPGLEPLLANELTALGASPTKQRGGVAFRGDQELVLRCGLWLGTASHLLLRIATFRCRALGELERKAAELPWRSFLHRRVPLELHATTRSSRVYHTGAITERLELAIAKALGKAPAPAAAEDEIVARIHARFHEDTCTLSLDATSTPLHRRGYRLDVRKAPLREDIAHALVLASGCTRDDALLDPFCGSGVIPIEAAGIACGLPPGRLRAPPLQQLALFDPDLWERVRTERAPGKPAAPMLGSDRDAGAVEAAKANAERAGVGHAIQFVHAPLAANPWLQAGGAPPRGVLVTNPPFGVRVPKGSDLLPLYQTLGTRAAKLGPGWRVAMLAHDVRLARRTGLPLHAAFTTRHGGLAVAALTGTAERPAAGSAPARAHGAPPA